MSLLTETKPETREMMMMMTKCLFLFVVYLSMDMEHEKKQTKFDFYKIVTGYYHPKQQEKKKSSSLFENKCPIRARIITTRKKN